MASPPKVVYRGSSEKSATQVAESLERHSEGYTVTVVTEASAAREKLRTAALDCVVSEYRLAAEDGIEFLQRVRETHPDLPFVLYTDEGDEHVAADAISAGVTDYIPRDSSTDGHAALADAVTDTVQGAESTPGTESERHRLERILKTVPECVVELDEDGQFIYANERAEEVLGLEQTAVTERAYNDPEWEIRDSAGNPIPDEQLPFQQVYSTAEPLYDYQHTVRWPDGSERILSVSGVPLFDDEGDVENVVFSLSDITEQKRREQGLERYRRMIENLDDIATIIAPDGTIKYVSPAVERVLGYKPDELVDENGFGHQPPESRDTVADAIEDIRDNPAKPRTVQTKFRRADGSWSWIESTLHNRRDDGVIDGILVSSREISERKRQNQRLQRRRKQLSQLHEVTRSLLGSGTPQEVAATASEKAVEILDFELNGIHFYDDEADGLVPIAVSDGSRELFGDVPVIDDGIAWKAYRSGEEQRYADISEAEDIFNPESQIESEVHLPLGSRGVFIVSSTEPDAFGTADIELARVLAANTEAALARISKEKQLRAREREVEEKNERLEEFSSIVSHDLRNPLNVAQTRTELLDRDRDGEHVEPLQRALDRMEELISDTLMLAKQGDIVAETEPVGLRSLARHCWQTVSTDEATIEVVEDVNFEGDRDRLRHVFENLFQNAIEHAGPAPTVRVGGIDSDGLYVEDTGPGIPEDRRKSVFESGETSERGGTGFGLAIVERIADAHGWQVDVVAGREGGARFEFTGVDGVGD